MRRATGPSRVALLRAMLLATLVVASCSGAAKKDDPLTADPFFGGDSTGSKSVNEVLNRRAPSVGWLADPDTPRSGAGSGAGAAWGGAPTRREPLDEDAEADLLERERAALAGGDLVDADEPAGGEEKKQSPGSGDEKSFSEKAQEATMSTLSILLGVGMTALPYLLGT